MRCLAASLLIAAASVVAATSAPAGQNAKQPDPKKTQPKFDPPKATKPDEATLKQIADKTEQLRKLVAALKEKKLRDDVLIEVEIYLKAAENIVRFEEWYAAASGKWALTTLDQGLERAKLADGGKPVWRDAPGKWVNRAYRSAIDNSIQPYAVLLPHDFGKEPGKKWRLDVVLHGRDGSLTEAKFIATHGGTAPKDLGYIQLEVYGRGNNAYRWAGETDVFEAQAAFQKSAPGVVDPNRVVLRGFSMGGAGTWHIGLHHPGRFCVIGPGAGFTTTHGYIASLPKELPDYQEKCLRIYDAVDYAENAFNVPIVAYSGEKDGQKKAADNIENALKSFKEPHHFTHLVAPALEHQMPKEWQAKAEAEYRKYADKGRNPNVERVRFVTYTPAYGLCDWVGVRALERTYEQALVDGTRKGTTIDLRTENVRRLFLVGDTTGKTAPTVTVDGQKVEVGAESPVLVLDKVGGRWKSIGLFSAEAREFPGIKEAGRQGPIDDAFASRFTVVGPSDEGWAAASSKQFEAVWDRYFRGSLLKVAGAFDPRAAGNLVLFGTPDTNHMIATYLPKLPITWTKEKLVVNGVEYDPKTHLPVLIYPNLLGRGYVVINSGHTFKEADLKGTNALLYPRLGDWAVVKPTPTAKDPAAFEVVAAGLFDENWQFPKKK
ncbi:Uncharacterized protein OS=Planctomyces maris DSM 8797 GN=PM8797T_06982 PE=4 SV=1 [Gemmataceae bacterium]|nr:Uncharacterized protein OS=Planctomyces maris DSM 8797 GN=PM8797T_06982 PE=4 SV=1 [Gemmataceae bacterium]VTT99104.1 Uncharacterized protein OS=Planctomyces maris DSM 8797 GN=PM8797T_06982 PE=4 SV=1 [Gemmataceae bacterium]